MTPQVVVAGAGPAGLAAATEAARAGAAVMLFEEWSETGGQLRYLAQPVGPRQGSQAERPGNLAERLLADAIAAGVEIRTETIVAGCFAGNELLVVRGDEARRLTPDTLVVTTGSTDLPYPFAGATLPGVFSARGLRVLMTRHRVLPGRRFAIVGGGEDAEELAVDVMLAGGEVIWSGMAPSSFFFAHGEDGVRELLVGQERHHVDVIAIAVGRQADPALAAMAGVPLAFAAELGGLVPVVDDRLESPVPGVFVAGDAAGVGSVSVAIAEGRLAGVAAAASHGLARAEDVAAMRATSDTELTHRLSIRASLQVVAARSVD